jgi:hypothetical protein
MVVLLPWPSNMNKIAKFTYFHVKPMFGVQMLVKQPFNHVNFDASIDLALPTWRLTPHVPNLHLLLHDLAVFFHDHFHAKAPQPLQKHLIKWMWILIQKMKYSFINHEGFLIRTSNKCWKYCNQTSK